MVLLYKNPGDNIGMFFATKQEKVWKIKMEYVRVKLA